MSPPEEHDIHRGALPFPRSLPEFMRLFPDDAACAAYLERCRWPKLYADGCAHPVAAGPWELTG